MPSRNATPRTISFADAVKILEDERSRLLASTEWIDRVDRSEAMTKALTVLRRMQRANQQKAKTP